MRLEQFLRVKEVDPDRQLAEVYRNPRERQQVYRDMYSCEYDFAPFIMYRIKKNLVRASWKTDADGMVHKTSVAGHSPLRVLLLGDSVTFGLGLSNPEQNITAQLAKVLLMAPSIRAAGISVVNASQPGYSLLQQALYSRFFIPKSEAPSVVLVWVGFNDIHNALYSSTFGGPLGVRESLVSSVKRLGRTLLKLLPAALLQLIFGRERAIRISTDKRLIGRQFMDDKDLYIGLFSDLKSRWEDEGARMVILLQPYLGGGTRRLTLCEEEVLMKRTALLQRQFGLDMFSFYRAAYDNYESWLKEAGCEYLNLLKVFDDQTDQMFLDRVHLTPHAVEVIANRVGQAILASLYESNPSTVGTEAGIGTGDRSCGY